LVRYHGWLGILFVTLCCCVLWSTVRFLFFLNMIIFLCSRSREQLLLKLMRQPCLCPSARCIMLCVSISGPNRRVRVRTRLADRKYYECPRESTVHGRLVPEMSLAGSPAGLQGSFSTAWASAMDLPASFNGNRLRDRHVGRGAGERARGKMNIDTGAAGSVHSGARDALPVPLCLPRACPLQLCVCTSTYRSGVHPPSHCSPAGM
jgi:hypothetical protein